MEKDPSFSDTGDVFNKRFQEPGYTDQGYFIYGRNSEERIRACFLVDRWLVEHQEEAGTIKNSDTQNLLNLYSFSQQKAKVHVETSHPETMFPQASCITCNSLSLLRDSIGEQLCGKLPIVKNGVETIELSSDTLPYQEK